VHAENRLLICRLCANPFLSKSALREHVDKEHAED